MKRLIMMAAAVAMGSLFADETYIESDGTQAINTGYYINALGRHRARQLRSSGLLPVSKVDLWIDSIS